MTTRAPAGCAVLDRRSLGIGKGTAKKGTGGAIFWLYIFFNPASTRSGVNGASRRRTPVASKIAFGMTGAIGPLDGSPPLRAGIFGRLISTISISRLRVCYLPMLASQNSAISIYLGNQTLPRLRTWARKSSRSCAMPTVPLTCGWMA